MRKKGISLVVFVITLAILLILLGITTSTIGNSVKDARLSAFANDLSSLEDAINTYYIQNGEYPILSENSNIVEYKYNGDSSLVDTTNSSNLISINSSKSEYVEKFKTELSGNQDDSEDTLFYKIDLNKINVEKTKRGTGEDGSNDIYVMAYPSQNVYYAKGFIVSDVVYYSLLDVSNKVNIDTSEETSSDTTSITQTSAGMTVKRVKKVWTNELDTTIDAYLEDGEQIYVKVPSKTNEIKLATKTGQNVIVLKSLDGSLGLTNDEIVSFNYLENKDRYIMVIKKKNNVELGRIKVSLANFEVENPSFPSDSDTEKKFNITSTTDETLITFTPTDSISGISKVRYEYLTKYNENGIVEYVNKNSSGENITEFDAEYMLTNSKKADILEDGKVQIKVPKDIEAIYIAIYDKAGNETRMTKNVRTSIYAGINLTKITTNLEIKFAIKSNSNVNITSAVASIGSSKDNFSNEKTLKLSKDSNNVYISNESFSNLNTDKIYIKLVVKDSNNVTETRIEQIDVQSLAYEMSETAVPGIIYEENKYYIDKNGDKALIPAGFKVSSNSSEQTISDGLVIIDKKDNEYVWIPCTLDGANGSVKYEKHLTEYTKHYSADSAENVDEELPSGVTETTQISKYGGFYIARYEAGVPDNQTSINSTSNSTSNVSGKPVSKSNKIAWTYISYETANANAKLVHDTDNVKSGLMTGTMWDTMCKWIEQSGINVNDSRAYGNYSDSISPANVTGYKTLQKTGYSQVWKVKNIYDIAGNVGIWISEGASTYRVTRGGSYAQSGSSYPVSYRIAYPSTHYSSIIGFRFCLYIM